jgi:hypothetical protein
MTALAADFEIRCSNGLDAVVGSVRFNSARTSLLPFDGAYPDISLRINATQGGYVTGGGLDCGAGRLDCEQSYGSAGHVSLEAVPSPGYSFVAWSDDCSGASPSTSVFVVLQTRCRAIFHPTQGQPGPADPAFADGALWLHRPSDPGAPLNVWVAPDVAFYPTVSGRSYVSMRMVLPNGREWRGSFAGRAGADLAPGTYEPASLSISGDLAPSCWTVKGSRVVVYEISWTAGGALASFAADFEQHCESDGVVSATFGAVRYHSTRPTLMPFDGAYPDIRLQITPSPLGFVSAAGLYCGPGQPDCEETYGSATTVALQAVPAAGSVFAGWTGDCEGRAATTVQVGRRLFCAAEFYLAPGTPGEDNARLRNGSLLIDSETGDSFGQGRRRLWTFDDASVSTLWSTASEVMLRFTTPDGNTWTFEFETAWSAPLLPGDYKDVEASSSLGNQGLSRLYIQGPSGSCHGTAAQFRIYEVAFDGAGKLSTFAADFEARCGAAYRPAVRGAVRFHSTRSSVTPYGEPLVQFSHSLRVLRSGIGSGTVTSSPAGIACRTDCNTVFPSAAMVTLTAAADAGSRFAGWLGSCRGTAPTCVLPMDSHRTVSPAFEPFAIPDAPVQVSPAGFLQSDSQTFVWRAVHAATWYYLWVDDSTGTRVRRWISSEEARCGTGTGYCSESAFGLASGPGRWWVIAWNPAGASAWGPGMAFSIAPVLDATILSPYPVPDVLPGGTARLWANVKNTGRTSLPTGTKTWFVVSGPNWTGDPWVGAADVSGLHPGSTRWVSFDWVVPAGRSAGTHNYFSRVYATGVGPISTPGAAQSFQISGGPTARIDALYPVTGATRGGTASLWARVTNTSAAAMPAGAKIWYYVDGPGWTGDHWVASVSIQGLAPGASQWYLLTYSIPGAAQAGTYTYWVQAWWGSAISPWSAGQSFVVQ